MSPARADLEVFGDKEAADLLRQVGDRAVDMKPAFAKCYTIMEEGLRKQFESKGAYLGTPWPALAKTTLERKAREGLSSEPLVGASQILKTSLEGGRGRIKSVTKTQVRIGTKDFVARFHQGGSKTKAGLPARKLVGVSRGDWSRVFATIRSYLSTGRL
jgi:phage gpG-like protein